MGYMGHTFLCLSPDLAQSSQNKDRSVPINLRAFCMKISGLFSIIGLFRNSDFLSLLAGFSNRTRRTYLATSTLRTPNTAREILLITEFRYTYLAMVIPTKAWTGLILNTSCIKKGLF